jgi:hypothetical protein
MMKAKEFSKMTQLEAVAELRTFDHLLISPAGIKAFNTVFGTPNIKPYIHRANPRDLKGLTLNDGAKSASGLCASDYAEAVCRVVGSPFQPWQSGRGFRLASACNALEEHYKSIARKLKPQDDILGIMHCGDDAI